MTGLVYVQTGAGDKLALLAQASQLGKSTDPTVNDDAFSGYDYGTLWFNTTAQRAWMCIGASIGAAKWIYIGRTSGGSIPSGFVGGYIAPVNVTAAGSTQGTATLISFAPSYLNGGTGGVRLPPASTWAASSPMNEIPLYNRSGVDLLIYPATGDAIETNAVNLPWTIYNKTTARCSIGTTGVVRIS